MYNGPYLRVITTRTTDGSSPLIDEEGRAVTKEAHLPLSAKPLLELQNRRLPKYLQKKIEVVPGYKEPEQPKVEDLNDQELEAQIAKLMELKAKRAGVSEVPQPKTEPVVPQQPIASATKAAKPVAPATPNLANQ